jgi:hypothetical protein
MSGAVFSCQSSRPRTKRQARLLMIVGSESEVLIDLDTDNRSEVLFEGEAQHRPVIRGTGFDGRSLIVEGRSRPFGEAGANLVCLDCSSRRTLWGVQISKMSLVDVRWKPGEPYLGFLAWNTEMRVAVIGRMLQRRAGVDSPRAQRIWTRAGDWSAWRGGDLCEQEVHSYLGARQEHTQRVDAGVRYFDQCSRITCFGA